MSIIEKMATQVAKDTVGNEVLAEEEAGEGDERGSIWTTLIPIIITIVQSLLQNCPLPEAEVKKAFKRPHRRQRAAVLKQVMETCQCCGVAPRYIGRMQNSLLVSASAISDVDASALINEARDDRNLLL